MQVCNFFIGYYEGRFRDNHLLLLEGEYRFSLLWRLKGAVFAGYGGVANRIEEFSAADFRYTAGVGLRILLLREEAIHIRLDYGIAKNASGFYLTIGEAF